ncbi:MAG TPA: flagellar protein FlaG [Rhodocyclaceae bacterium]
MNVNLPQAAVGDKSSVQPATGGAPRVPAAVDVAAASDTGTPAQARQPTNEEVQRAVENLKRITQPVAQNLQFSVDKETGDTVIKVVDEITKEVIRQIPSQEVLDLAKNLDKLQGVLLRRQA